MSKRVVEGVMFGKFNARDSRGSITVANKKGISIVEKSFKKVLEEVVVETPVEEASIVEEAPIAVEAPVVEEASDPMDEIFIWQAAFDKKRRGL